MAIHTCVLSCKPSGTYVYKAKAITCGSPSLITENTDSVTLTTIPTVSIDYAGPDEEGHGTVTVEYDFPNTSQHTQRSLQHQLFRSDGSSGAGPSLQPTDQQGTWTFAFPMTCYPTGTYTHKITSIHCNGTVTTATAIVNVEADPEITVSPAEPDDDDNIDLTVTFDFPNTDASTQRSVQISGENAGGSGVIASFQPDTQSGTRQFNYNVACAPPGTMTFVGKAWSCGRVPPAEDRKPVTLGTPKPKITVTLRKIGFNATTGQSNVEARVDYDMGKGSTNWNIGAKLLSWTNADGQFYPNDTLLTEVPTTRVGVRTFSFWTPSGAQQVMVLGTANSCAGRGTHEASVDCGCEGNQQGPVGTDDPVYFADGNVRVTDVDPLPQIAGYGLVRTYNSNEQVAGLFGRGFTTLFDRRMILNSDGSEQLVALVRETNEVVAFRGSGSTFRQTWPTARGAFGTLTYDVATATYRHRAAGSSELSVFRASDGRLIAIHNIPTGREAQFAYDGAGRPQSLTDSWSGIAWNLTIDTPNRRIASIAVSDHPALVWSYNYDGTGNLLSVIAPGSATWRTYEYASNRMTASRDALNNLIESHTYDADGFGISSTGPSDEIANIAYNLPGSIASERLTRVTYKTGAIAEYALRPKGGAWRTVHASGGCASCGAHDGTFVRDELGRVVREQSADGYITVIAYTADRVLSEERLLKPTGCDPQTDSQQCRLGQDALASAELEATDATFAVAYEYTDPLWPEKATVVTRPSVGVSAEQRQDNYVYHPISGAVASATVCGWKPGIWHVRSARPSPRSMKEPVSRRRSIPAAYFNRHGSRSRSLRISQNPWTVRVSMFPTLARSFTTRMIRPYRRCCAATSLPRRTRPDTSPATKPTTYSGTRHAWSIRTAWPRNARSTIWAACSQRRSKRSPAATQRSMRSAQTTSPPYLPMHRSRARCSWSSDLAVE
ncbi:MAG TPA: DUF6531 domain-containing protein [Thermoanaerobaculia bacterium]|nr:DUF6531 domain-containing protein [Thermoanaerobaculia bacterium]